MEENATDKQIAFLAKKGIDATNMGKKEAHVIISDLIGKPDDVKTVKPGISNDAYASLMAKPKKDSQSSFYVAYAKDLYIADLEKHGVANMQDCINAIKLAKEQL